jgi:hypothetical protein
VTISLLQLFAISLTLGTLPSLAQESNSPPICTERSIQNTAPVLDLVPAGSLQIESGTSISFQRKNLVADLPEDLIRFGLTNRVELRFITSNMVYQHSAIAGIDPLEAGDAALSLKLHIAGANTFTPNAAIVSMSFPVGDRGLTSNSYDPSIFFGWTQTLRRRYTFIEAVQTTLTTVSQVRTTELFPVIGASRTFSDRFSAFVDYAPEVLLSGGKAYEVDGGLTYAATKKQVFDVRGAHTRSPDGFDSYIYDAGLTYALGHLQQLDVRMGYSGDSNGLHTVASFGYSVRYDQFLQRVPLLYATLRRQEGLR